MINYYFDNEFSADGKFKPYTHALEANEDSLPPDNAVRFAPPPYDKDTQCPCLVNGKWELVTSHLGKIAFNTKTLDKEIVNYLGPIKDGFTLLEPKTLNDKWDGKQWISPPQENAKRQNLAFIIESYRNGGSWYNKYSNGFIEQSGLITIDTPELRTTKVNVVNLLIPMISGDYSVDLSLSIYDGPWGWVKYAWADRYLNRFYICSFTEANAGRNTLRWTVRGY